MALQRRFFNSLPSYLQTNYNNLSSSVTDDIVFEPESATFVSGYIGDTSKLTSQELARTPLLIENTAIRQKYQFTVGIAQFDPQTQTYVSGCFYDDLLNHLILNGAIIDNPNRLFSAFYYAWTPPIDYDKIVNPAQYFWTGTGDADANGEYIIKEAAGSQTFIHQFDGVSLVGIQVTIVNGLPLSGSGSEIVEDVSTPNRYLYVWNATEWSLLNFRIAADTIVIPNYVLNDYVYVCRTGVNFNRPIVWVYRSGVGRWVSIPVVVNITFPETPLQGMIWEDATVPPSRILRIYDGNQWQILNYTSAVGPSGTPLDTTYLFDIRPLSAVDTWSAQNWWRAFADLSLSDQGALGAKHQGSRPILEFWGNIEPAIGLTHTSRNQFPYFNLYAVSPSSYEIIEINPTNFPGLDTTGQVISTIFNYEVINGMADPVLGFGYKHGSDGTPMFNLDLETLSITIGGGNLLGYRYFRDTSTGFVHSIWEKTNNVLLQTIDSNGLYNIPLNLQYNPDHIITTEVSRTDFINHFASVINSQVGFSGTAFGANSYRFTPKDLTLNATMIDPEESLQRVMSVLQTNQLDIPDSIRQMSRDYNKMMFRFVNQLNTYWNDGTLSTPIETLTVSTDQAVDAILTQIFLNRNSEFPFYHSVMGTYIHTVIVNGNPLVYDTTPQPIYIPDSAVAIGASRPYLPQIFDDDGILKIRGHDGSLIIAFGDVRDLVILNLETRFFSAIPDYLKIETTIFSSTLSDTFHLRNYYGNFIPTPTTEPVVRIVSDYTTIVLPVINNMLYSINQQLYVTWDGGQWLTSQAQINDIFLNQDDSFYYIFNGYYANKIITFNRNYVFDYSENEFRRVIQREFERWITTYELDFITNNDYDQDDPFSWNFSSAGIEGNWRGIYRRIYSTIRPHSHPWEVIGYSIMPSWWLTSYIPTSYASDGTPRYANTHHMWEDFQDGIINPLSGLISVKEMMTAPIPVDMSGDLLDPIAANVISEAALTPSSLGDDWSYGDGGPVEQTFYDSYYYQFTIALAGYLMKTGLFVDLTWTQYYRELGTIGINKLWNAPAIVYNTTLTRPRAADIPSQLSLDAIGNTITNPGLNAWISEYTNIIGLSPNADFNKAIKNCVATLGWKTSGFINSARTMVELLNGDEVPNEDLNVVLHQGPSVNEYYQSGIIIVRDIDGFRVFGTDVLNPYFIVDVGVTPASGSVIEQLQSFTYDGVNFHPKNGNGSILTSSVNAGGSGYTVGSYGIINQNNSSGTASFVVDTVNAAGSVLTFHIVQVGSAYSVGSGVATVINSASFGTGLFINILAVTTIAYPRSAIIVSEIIIPPSTNDSAKFSIIINGYRVPDKYVHRINATTFSIDQTLKLSVGDNIVASVVNVVSNPSTAVGSFTVNGVQITYFATGSGQLINYPYGHLFRTLNDVANMMIGHGRYLLTQGWIFERLTNGTLRDWIGAAKAFAIWSTDLSIKYNGNSILMKDHIFQFSVMGRQTQFNAPFGMILGIEDIRNGSYGVVDVNNQPIRSNHLTVVAMSGDITVSSDNVDIFGLRLYISEVQHVIFFPNISTFGDIMYEPALGLKQDAVFIDTYRTTNWTGRMEAPGFLISGGQIAKLPTAATPTPRGALFPNWEKRVVDVTRYYDRFDPPDDPILTGMARATFGYIPQTYMNELNIDDRIQFNFFRGTLKSKGTFQPYRAFVRGTTIGSSNCVIAEDWAWKFAKYGDRRQVVVLFDVDQSDFVDASQAIHFDDTIFSIVLTGNQSIACFNILDRFIFSDLIVTVNGILQVFGIDYTLTPINTGYELCFIIPPLMGSLIKVADNDTIVHAQQQTVCNTSFLSEIDLVFRAKDDNVTDIRANNILFAINGKLGIAGVDYFVPEPKIITYTPSNTLGYGLLFGNVGQDIFTQTIHYGDDFTIEFNAGSSNQNSNTIIVVLDGLLLTHGIDFIIDDTFNFPFSYVKMLETPALNSVILIIAVINPNLARIIQTNKIADGVQTLFTVPGASLTSYRQVIVAVDGLIQVGAIPGAANPVPNVYAIDSFGVRFNIAPLVGQRVIIYVFLDVASEEIKGTADDRVLHIPAFSPPNGDGRWINPPPQDIYRDRPYRFPINLDGTINFQKFLYSAAIVDQTAHAPAITLFHWDPTIGLHETLALSLVDYKTPYDPAFYDHGPLAGVGNNILIWGANQIGQVWWNDSTAIYSNYKRYLPDYMKVKQEWGKLLYFKASITRDNDLVTVVTLDSDTNLPTINNLLDGQMVVISGADQPTYNGNIQISVVSSDSFTFSVTEQADSPATGNIIVQIGVINCYEWVASPVFPSAWAAFISSQKGFEIYTGKVLNGNNASYSTQEIWDINGNAITTYYFWVQANTRVIPSKNLSVRDIAGRLTSPAAYLVPYFGIIDEATLFVFPGDDIVLDNSAIEITYWWYEMPQHIEWLLIGENDDFYKLPRLVTDKLLDSMLGVDVHNNLVPNTTLAPTEIYGTCFFPAQTVFQNVANAINTYTIAVNSILVNIDIDSIEDLFAGLALSDELTSMQVAGYWSRVTWWKTGINSIVYDTVVNQAELIFNTYLGLYTIGDIVKEIQSDQVDPWSHAQVAAYYQYDGTIWNLVAIDNHAVAINSHIVFNSDIFREFFGNLTASITKLQANTILFTLLNEMVRQNPMIDWFFKTSYIDVHVTQPLPITPYVFPDQVTLITDAVLNLKPYRTKLRDIIATYSTQEDLPVIIAESQITKHTLIFDRLACDLTDENSWDTIPWDAAVTYPETEVVAIPFMGNGLQTCFPLVETVPDENIVVFVNGYIARPFIDYSLEPIHANLCFTIAPMVGAVISVVLDGNYDYFNDFHYAFRGDSIKDSEIVPNRVTDTTINNVFSSSNGVYQIDFIIQVTSDTEIVYETVPTSEIEVNGTVFGADAIGDIFIRTSYFGDGVTLFFDTTVPNQTLNTVVVFVNGVWQTPGISYTIDNLIDVPNSAVKFGSTQIGSDDRYGLGFYGLGTYSGLGSGFEPTDNIVIYAVKHPQWVNCATFVFLGDGITAFFPISNLISVFPPMIFANVDGIQQNNLVGDFIIEINGIVFDKIPRINAEIAVFVVWSGVGERLVPSSYPATIEWDWAYWDYPDLGRKEFDFAGFFVGDDVTESFIVPIPQATSLLYNVVVKFFRNGVMISLGSLGLVMITTKLAIGVNIFLNGPLPIGVYAALYISRGLYEGLEPTFGYQDPNGVIFAPTPSSYQHFFARLISGTFDPSTIMVGCPDHTPEERIEQLVQDNFTICVETYVEQFPTRKNPVLFGVSAVGSVGNFAFNISTQPILTGLSAQVFVDVPIISLSPSPFSLAVVSSIGSVGFSLSSPFVGLAASVFSGVFSFGLISNPTLNPIGIEVVSGLAGIRPPFDLAGMSSISDIGIFGIVVSPIFVGLVATASIASPGFDLISNPSLNPIGIEAVSSVGQLDVGDNVTGDSVVSSVGTFIVNLTPRMLGLSAVSHVSPFVTAIHVTGVQANTAIAVIIAIVDIRGFLAQKRLPSGALLVTNPTASGAVPQRASDSMLMRRADLGNPNPPGYYQIGDTIESDDSTYFFHTFSFSPFGPFVDRNGDGGEVYVTDGVTVRIAATEDGSQHSVLQGFYGAGCGGTGWVLFKNDVSMGSWHSLIATLSDKRIPSICSVTSSAFTRYRLELVAIPYIISGVQTSITLPTIISEHYNGTSIATSNALERFFFHYGVGRVVWEAWTTTPATDPSLPVRCPGTVWSVAPAAGWYLNDGRYSTQIISASGALTGDLYAWPPTSHPFP